MNISKLKKAIVKEFKRSPAKSVVLLLLCPVALYFIAPLFKGWLPKSNNSNSAAASIAAPDSAPFLLPLPTTEPAKAEATKSNWREIAKWMETDQLSLPTRVSTAGRSPFINLSLPDPEAETETNEEEQEAEIPPPSVHDIFEEGYLTLTMTMLGKQRRLATINGKVFSEGDTVPVHLANGVNQQELFNLHLARVERHTAVLAYDDETFELELRNRLPTDAIIIRPAKK